MPSIMVAVLLLAWMALAMGGVAWGSAGEQRWTQYCGQVKSITIDRCGQRPGLCEGTMVLRPRRGLEVILAIRPGMWIKRGGSPRAPGGAAGGRPDPCASLREGRGWKRAGGAVIAGRQQSPGHWGLSALAPPWCPPARMPIYVLFGMSSGIRGKITNLSHYELSEPDIGARQVEALFPSPRR